MEVYILGLFLCICFFLKKNSGERRFLHPRAYLANGENFDPIPHEEKNARQFNINNKVPLVFVEETKRERDMV